MANKATIRNGYRLRLGAIALVLLGVTGWFLYDGLVKYPRQQQMYETYTELRENYPQEPEKWEQHARQQGWPVKTPVERSDADILLQLVCAAIAFPIGVIFGVAYLRTRNRWIATDEAGVQTSWGVQIPWQAIQSVDNSRWKSKGIAVLHYQHNGTAGRITLDDWKYDQQATHAAMDDVRQYATAAQIAGDSDGGEVVASSEKA